MTEQMAIEYGKDYLKDLICACCKVEDTHKEFVRLSIDALEKQSMVNEILNELKQYRAIGTVEEIQRMKDHLLMVSGMCKDYYEIGTVEELQALKEKSVAKKVLHHKQRTKNDFGCFVTDEFWVCPTCKKVHLEYYVCEYCDCGQHLDWE